MIRQLRGRFKHLYLTVETILSPDRAKSVVDGGRLTTTSTICSPPLVVPQEGLSREMKLSSPSIAGGFETKFCPAGWTATGLVIRGGLEYSLEALMKGSNEVFASDAFVEDAGRMVATGSNAVSSETVHRGDQQWQGCRVIVRHTLDLVF